MPPHAAFATAEGFCGTLIHEMGHYVHQHALWGAGGLVVAVRRFAWEPLAVGA